jgi:hypothetical protein
MYLQAWFPLCVWPLQSHFPLSQMKLWNVFKYNTFLLRNVHKLFWIWRSDIKDFEELWLLEHHVLQAGESQFASEGDM